MPLIVWQFEVPGVQTVTLAHGLLEKEVVGPTLEVPHMPPLFDHQPPGIHLLTSAAGFSWGPFQGLGVFFRVGA